MNYNSDVRRRESTITVNDTLAVNYAVSQSTGQPVSHINATILQSAQRIGTVNVDIVSNLCYISLENFSTLSHADRKTLVSAISDHLEAILTEPVEPAEPTE